MRVIYSGFRLQIAVSYIEIYNEAGYDLLEPQREVQPEDNMPRLCVLEDDEGNVHLRNMTLQPAGTEEAALNLVCGGCLT